MSRNQYLRKIVCIFFLLHIFFSFCIQAQNIDSLKKVALTNLHDSDRVKTLLRISHSYSNFQRDSAMDYAQDALTLSQQIQFKKGEAQSLNIIGSILSGTSNYPQSFEYHLASLKIAEEIKNYTLIAALYNNLALVSTEMSDFRTSLEYLFKAKSLFEQQNNKAYLSDACLNIGVTYERMEELDSALMYQSFAYQLAHEADYLPNIGTIIGSRGAILFKLGKIDSAIIYLRKAVSVLFSSGEEYDKESLAGTYYELSRYFEKINQIDSSIYYAKQSYALSIQVNDQKRVLNASKQLNLLYESKKMLDSAYKYSKIANNARESILGVDRVAKLEGMKINEQTRQREIARTIAKEKAERKSNLQLFSIAIFIVTFFSILIIFSRRKVNPKALKYLGLLGVLLLFEFIAVFIHPYIASWTHHDPVYMLLILVAIGALLVPLHHKMEHWVKSKLVKEGKLSLQIDNKEEVPLIPIEEKDIDPISPETQLPATEIKEQ